MKIQALIPFVGFYESLHDSAMDDVVEQSENDDMPIDYDNVGWGLVQDQYAKFYAESFLSMLDVDGQYVKLTSPREYNFGTDQITVEVEESVMVELFDTAMSLHLAQLVKEEMTPRSGFSPYYSMKVKDWGPVNTWKPAQLELIFRVLAEHHHQGSWDQSAEYDLMEPTRCNGYLDNWIYGAIGK